MIYRVSQMKFYDKVWLYDTALDFFFRVISKGRRNLSDKISADKIFDSKSYFRDFYLPKFCPIK